MKTKAVIYFVEFARDGIVKIGYTGGPVRSRLAHIKWHLGSSEPLILLGTMRGGRQVEQKIHRILFHYRKHGEWFSLQPAVRNFIETCIEKNDVEIARAIHGDSIPEASAAMDHYLHDWTSYEERRIA